MGSIWGNKGEGWPEISDWTRGWMVMVMVLMMLGALGEIGVLEEMEFCSELGVGVPGIGSGGAWAVESLDLVLAQRRHTFGEIAHLD